jgi:hypothetical protein
MTTKKQIKIVNCETGEETLRDLTPEEIANYKTQAEAKATREAESEAKAQAKTELLERLGITEDEAKLLLA